MVWDSFVHNVLVHPLCWLSDLADAFVRWVDRLHERTAAPLGGFDYDAQLDDAVELEVNDPLERALARELGCAP